MVHHELAAGGMASVWLARQRGDGGWNRVVAVKRLHPDLGEDPQTVAMFRDEARLAARIRHPNVVPTLDVVSDEDEILIVMEYVVGESLSRLLLASAKERRKKSQSAPDGEILAPVPPPVAVAIACNVLDGLHAAHQTTNERGIPLQIVHRDVSPQNILVGVDGIARVVDFGIAKAVGRMQETTREGQLKGKLFYMPPEQLKGGTVDRRSDVWAASVVLWEMLVGRPLFREPALALRYHAGADEIPAPSTFGAPAELDEVVARGLARSPVERYSSAREMLSALEKVVRPASPREVAQWVQRLAKDVLKHRARLVDELEAPSERMEKGDVAPAGKGDPGTLRLLPTAKEVEGPAVEAEHTHTSVGEEGTMLLAQARSAPPPGNSSPPPAIPPPAALPSEPPSKWDEPFARVHDSTLNVRAKPARRGVVIAAGIALVGLVVAGVAVGAYRYRDHAATGPQVTPSETIATTHTSPPPLTSEPPTVTAETAPPPASTTVASATPKVPHPPSTGRRPPVIRTSKTSTPPAPTSTDPLDHDARK